MVADAFQTQTLPALNGVREKEKKKGVELQTLKGLSPHGPFGVMRVKTL